MKNFDPPADLLIPEEIEIRRSEADPARPGVWCKNGIKEGRRFGPFIGEKAVEYKEHMDPSSMWEIVDVETKEFLFYIDGTNPRKCNWMRYVNCVRDEEAVASINIIAEQDGIDIYYKTLKDIEQGEELLLAAENMLGKKRRSKQRSLLEIKRASITPTPSDTSPTKSEEVAAEKRDASETVSQRGRKRSAKKFWTMELVTDEPGGAKDDKPLGKLRRKEKPSADSPTKETKRQPVGTKSTSESGSKKLVVDDSEMSGDLFRFDLAFARQGKNRSGRKMFHCDICSGVYRHGFSLKRHYLRAHINGKYISKLDALNCGVNLKGGSRAGLDVDLVDDDADTVASEHSQAETGSTGDNPANDKKSLQDLNDDSSVSSDHSQSVQSLAKFSTADDASNAAEKLKDENVDELESQTLNLEVEEIHEDLSPPGSSGSSRDGLRMDVDDADSKTVRLAARQSLPGLYRCNVCEKVFDTSKELRDHLTKHSVAANDLKFSCENCSMKFKHRQNLIRHEVVHSGAKTFPCNYCDKKFPTLTNQRRHERIHRGQRLTCSLCPSTFTQTGDLKKHMRKLHPETFQECAYCAKYYTSETALSMHLHKVHRKDSDSNRKKISARRCARKHSLEMDQAESRRLAGCDSVATAPVTAGSLPSQLEYACTICLKRFLDYANMCRHRRLAHGRGAPRLASEGVRLSTADDDDYSSTDEVDGSSAAATWDRIDAQQLFFARVSRNIANNLQNFMEGKAEQVRNASLLVKWRHMASLSDHPAKEDSGRVNKSTGELAEKAEDVKLEKFNFPEGFRLCDDEQMFYGTSDSASERQVKDFSSVLAKSYTTIIPSKGAQLGKSGDATVQEAAHSVVSEDVPCKEKAEVSQCKSDVGGTLSIADIDGKASIQCSAQVMDLSKHSLSENISMDCPVDLSSPTKSDNLKSTPTTVKPNDSRAAAAIENKPGHVVHNATKLVLAAADVSREPASNRKCVCLVCFREFSNRYELFCHQSERHANIDCRHVEVDPSFNAIWCRKPNSVGLLNVSSNRLPKGIEPVVSSSKTQQVQCTRCSKSFTSSCALHQHISECGDYWRSLNTRVRWIFVLRGNQVPSEEKPSKKRGKFQWSSLHDSAHRQPLHKSAPGGSLGTPTDQTSPGRRVGRMFGRTRSTESLIEEDDPTKKHRNPYSPWKHARRRREAELMEVEKCRGCGEVFETILQLERHIPSCTEKQRLIELHAAEDGEDSDDNDDFDPSKHLCIYCERQFTYLRTLRKHVQETCASRKTLVDQGEYLDAEWESDLNAKLAAAVGGATSVGSCSGVGRDLSASFGEVPGAADEADASMDSKRGGRYRRRRGNNWGYRGKPRRVPVESSRKLSQESGDSLFDWEDAFLSNWAQEEKNSAQTCGSQEPVVSALSAATQPKILTSFDAYAAKSKLSSSADEACLLEGKSSEKTDVVETKDLRNDQLTSQTEMLSRSCTEVALGKGNPDDISEKSGNADSDLKQGTLIDDGLIDTVNVSDSNLCEPGHTSPTSSQSDDVKNMVVDEVSSIHSYSLGEGEHSVSTSVTVKLADSSCDTSELMDKDVKKSQVTSEQNAKKQKSKTSLSCVDTTASENASLGQAGVADFYVRGRVGLDEAAVSKSTGRLSVEDKDIEEDHSIAASASADQITHCADSSLTNEVEADSSVSNEHEADSSLGSNEVEGSNEGESHQGRGSNEGASHQGGGANEGESSELQSKRRKRKRARLTMAKRRKPSQGLA